MFSLKNILRVAHILTVKRSIRKNERKKKERKKKDRKKQRKGRKNNPTYNDMCTTYLNKNYPLELIIC